VSGSKKLPEVRRLAADPIQIAPLQALRLGSQPLQAMFQLLDVFCFGHALLMHRSNKTRLSSISGVLGSGRIGFRPDGRQSGS
jgi:hypothetical protein